MPLYEFRCRTCDTVFTERRPMSRSSDPATCPDGHDDARRVLSVFATAGKGASSSSDSGAAPSPAAWSGGGCGGGCACH
ncbi:MAG: zinc ribbon domain-containing protein [Acidimicrobiales bacterium]|nr:zinc ribbon domain-containing protein [Acidimicrobiales bacterium]